MNNSWRFFNPQSRKITKQLTFTVYTVAIIVVSLYPTSPDETLFAWDKLGHFLAYMVMLLIGFMAFPSKNGRFTILLFILMLGLTLEWAQGFVPGRDTSWRDALANGLGVLLGIILSILFQHQLTWLDNWFWTQLRRLIPK